MNIDLRGYAAAGAIRLAVADVQPKPLPSAQQIMIRRLLVAVVVVILAALVAIPISRNLGLQNIETTDRPEKKEQGEGNDLTPDQPLPGPGQGPGGSGRRNQPGFGGSVGVRTVGKAGASSPPSGVIVFNTDRDGNYEIYKMNEDGTGQTRLTNTPGSDLAPALSPDGSRIAFQAFRESRNGIFVMNHDGSGVRRLTPRDCYAGESECGYAQARWSRDGRKIAYERWWGYSPLCPGLYCFEMWIMNADGAGHERVTTNAWTPEWSPDGMTLAFTRMSPDVAQSCFWGGQICEGEIHFLELSNRRERGIGMMAQELRYSRDGRQIAGARVYYPQDSRQTRQAFVERIFVMNADGTNLRWLTPEDASQGSNGIPSWSLDDKRLGFLTSRGGWEIYIMNVDGSNQLRLTNNTSTETFPDYGPRYP